MKCKNCGAENSDGRKCCTECGEFLEGYTVNNVTGEYGYRGGNGNWYRSAYDYTTMTRLKQMPLKQDIDGYVGRITGEMPAESPLTAREANLRGEAFGEGMEHALRSVMNELRRCVDDGIDPIQHLVDYIDRQLSHARVTEGLARYEARCDRHDVRLPQRPAAGVRREPPHHPRHPEHHEQGGQGDREDESEN